MMFNRNIEISVYMTYGTTVFRKSYSGLVAIIKLRFNLALGWYRLGIYSK